MTITTTTKLSIIALTLFLVFAITYTFVYANGEDHSEDGSKSMATKDNHDSEKILKMKQTIALLTQIIDLLKKKAELEGKASVQSDHHSQSVTSPHDAAVSDKLKVWVEVHSYKTHAHVQHAGKIAESFVVEGIAYTDEDKVIEAIAKKTGLSAHIIETTITFPEGKLNEKGDSVAEHDEDTDKDTSGIHIMSDGKIMWGNGTEVHGATHTSDKKVKLTDGTIITPAFDLR
jgi:hypothetical protein